MFGPFDKMFDFDHDGQLNGFERAMQHQFLDQIMKEDSDRWDDDENEEEEDW